MGTISTSEPTEEELERQRRRDAIVEEMHKKMTEYETRKTASQAERDRRIEYYQVKLGAYQTILDKLESDYVTAKEQALAKLRQYEFWDEKCLSKIESHLLRSIDKREPAKTKYINKINRYTLELAELLQESL